VALSRCAAVTAVAHSGRRGGTREVVPTVAKGAAGPAATAASGSRAHSAPGGSSGTCTRFNAGWGIAVTITARYLQLARHNASRRARLSICSIPSTRQPGNTVCAVAGRAMAAIAALRLARGPRANPWRRYRRTHRLAGVQTLARGAIAACRNALLGGRRETL
jgi:hypothetical protein